MTDSIRLRCIRLRWNPFFKKQFLAIVGTNREVRGSKNWTSKHTQIIFCQGVTMNGPL